MISRFSQSFCFLKFNLYRYGKAPTEPGAIAGVSADFARYAFLSALDDPADGRDARGGSKRKVGG
jgi:hypothetical protein